jgi:hypothetical protein
LPTLNQARAEALVKQPELQNAGEIDWSAPSRDQIDLLEATNIRIRPAYIRVEIEFETEINIIDLERDRRIRRIPLIEEQIHQQWTEALRDIYQRRHHYPCRTRRRRNQERIVGYRIIRGSALLTDESYEEATDSQITNPDPTWNAGISIRAWPHDDETINIEIIMSNRLRIEEVIMFPDIYEVHLFNPWMEIGCDMNVVKRVQLHEIMVRDYRYDTTIYASGINCDVHDRIEGDRLLLSTNVLPIFEQRRRTSNELPELTETNLQPTFDALENDPIPVLTDVLRSMREYHQRWLDRYEEFRETGLISADDPVRERYIEAAGKFESEIELVSDGIDILNSPDGEELLTAFQLMNRTMVQAGARRGITTWRLFQLTFILSSLPGIYSRVRDGETPQPRVLWYPTGGGKTEAYLGLILTHAFWDRIRGKEFGTTAWLKFPLRLLSMQQLTRVVGVVSHANTIREVAPELEGRRGDLFSIGLYAGGGNSTNWIDFPPEPIVNPTNVSRDITTLLALGTTEEFNHKVDRCPFCNSTITTTYDEERTRFIHQCSSDDCGQFIPLHVTDTETLKNLSTVIVGTIDKLASIGRVPLTKILFGYAMARCPVHGYTTRDDGRCNVLGCPEELLTIPRVYDAAPSLMIQDELHFLKETLGAFDAHYETMTLEISRMANEEIGDSNLGPYMVIGSTATIEGYEDQIHQMYGFRESVRFPEPGPVSQESFYDHETDEVQRYVLGFRPHNMSHVDAVMKVLLSYHEFILPLAALDETAWESLGEPFSELTEGNKRDLIQPFVTSLTYALTKMECSQVKKSFLQQLNPLLEPRGLPIFTEGGLVNLTGDSSGLEVQNALDRLETPGDDPIQAITATSIISHGVDVGTLNFMVFRGQPHTSSEWIQAMSRVGRIDGRPAIVVNVYHPMRERDNSHFNHHRKYVEHAGALIRDVPVTRYSTRALIRTLPGLLNNAVMYWSGSNMVWLKDDFMLQLRGRRDHWMDILRRYYAIDTAEPSSKEQRLQDALDQEFTNLEALLTASQADKTMGAMRPMISLREVDEPASIIPRYEWEVLGGGE